jgi:hypothetical protein
MWSMNSSRDSSPRSIWALSLYSHSPVSSGEQFVDLPRPRNRAISSEKALAVGCSSRPLRCRYSSEIRFSMVCRAGGRRAEAARRHRGAQFLVLDQLAGAFHRRQQRGFVEARRRLGEALPLDLDIVGPGLSLGTMRRQVGPLASSSRPGPPCRTPPASPAFTSTLPSVLKASPSRPGDARRDVVFGRRIENRQEAPVTRS